MTPSQINHLSRRRRQTGVVRALVTSVVAGAVVAGALLVNLPLLTLNPGPTPDVAKFIKIDAQTYPSKGSLHMTTVTVEGATLFDAIRGWISPDVAVIDREAIYGGKSQQEVNQETAAQMTASEQAASLAALGELGFKEVGAQIGGVLANTEASKVLRPDDVIVSLDDRPVMSVGQVREHVSGRAVGETVRMTIRRDDRPKEVSVRLVTTPGEPRRPLIGITMCSVYERPLQVTIDAQEIGGPSAGLMFGASIVDLLDPADLTAGKRIAGTGTLDCNGNVGIVGGVRQKVKAAERLGASYFLVPMAELQEARAAVDTQMKVIGVSTLKEAIAALRKLR